MRRLPTVILLLLTAAACTNKRATETVSAPRPVVTPSERGELIGMNGEELAARLGTPALQVREGDSMKLQFRSSRCVLDAFLYRGSPTSGILRVVHIEARDREGRDVDSRTCLATLERR